jgi:hypothetical protein
MRQSAGHGAQAAAQKWTGPARPGGKIWPPHCSQPIYQPTKEFETEVSGHTARVPHVIGVEPAVKRSLFGHATDHANCLHRILLRRRR